ncbi:hypothetical protein SAMN05518847_102724 [Paenibacillus sp. OV219]|nr:hypothetical protein SAMN05518847_102724 [Paenibacillus sp. OV219]
MRFHALQLNYYMVRTSFLQFAADGCSCGLICFVKLLGGTDTLV